MKEAIPQHTALYLQLAAIAGNEPNTSFIEIRPLGPKMEPAPDARAFMPISDTAGIAQRVLADSHDLNVFVGVAPRVREGGTASDVERVWALWADCDGADALAALAQFRPLPSIVIRSGSKDSAHAYWPMRTALSPGWAQRCNRRLALALGSDRAATDPARILRPVGSRNHKHSPARPVVCTRLETDSFTSAEVVGGLPDDRAYLPTRRPERRESAGDPSKLVASIVQVVAEKQEGERNHALFWAACRVSEHGVAGEIDEDAAVEELRSAALHIGLSESEINKTLTSGLAAGRQAA
jgi:hypothetical protein